MEAIEAKYELPASDKKFIGWHMFFALFALALGTLFGPLQALQHASWFNYAWLQPLLKSYYQGLTLHGVLNALGWLSVAIYLVLSAGYAYFYFARLRRA